MYRKIDIDWAKVYGKLTDNFFWIFKGTTVGQIATYKFNVSLGSYLHIIFNKDSREQRDNRFGSIRFSIHFFVLSCFVVNFRARLAGCSKSTMINGIHCKVSVCLQ